MKRIILLFFLCIYAFFSAGAIDWPVEDRYLTATFGESRIDHFHTGIDLGREQEVKPVERGELVFINDSRMYGTIPSGMGNFIILEHAGKIRSVYAHLAPNSIPVNRERFQKRDTLGIIGESGYSLGKHLHFELIDRKLDRLVNPLLVLPPNRDEQAPVIESLRFNELEPVSPGGRVITENTELPISIVTYDPSAEADYFLPTAPYSIEVRVNGESAL
ncbi:MAG: M23 family metallopeptidase, partial [Spirochaetia bacterium]|nr:M23 family metallopeptidase [Spirochaetales bacterium]MCF7944592.1 M23 family metallopeptidase [Spirochaetia bacterium]